MMRKKLPMSGLIVAVLIPALALTLTTNTSPAVAQGDTSVPSKPTGLTTTEVTHNSVALAWDDPNDTSNTEWVVPRRNKATDASGVFHSISTTDSNAYTDTIVVPNTSYVYRVKARNSAGLSNRSRWLDVDTPSAPPENVDDPPTVNEPDPVPDSPTGLTASATHEAVTLSWDDPSDDTIFRYHILKNEPWNLYCLGFVVVGYTAQGKLSYVDPEVMSGDKPVYRVQAENTAGVSPRSSYAKVTVPSAPPERATEVEITVPPGSPPEPEIRFYDAKDDLKSALATASDYDFKVFSRWPVRFEWDGIVDAKGYVLFGRILSREEWAFKPILSYAEAFGDADGFKPYLHGGGVIWEDTGVNRGERVQYKVVAVRGDGFNSSAPDAFAGIWVGYDPDCKLSTTYPSNNESPYLCNEQPMGYGSVVEITVGYPR